MRKACHRGAIGRTHAYGILAIAVGAAALVQPVRATDLVVGSGSYLSGDNNTLVNVTVQSGGHLSPGNNTNNNHGIGTAGTLALGSCNLLTGAILNIDAAPPNGDLITINNGLSVNTGVLLSLLDMSGNPFASSATLNIFNVLGGAAPSPSSLQTNLTVSNPVNGYAYTWGSNGTFLTLTVSLANSPTTGTWSVDRDGGWDEGGLVWTGGQPDGIGNSAIFGSAITAPRTVSLNGTRTVGTLTFNNTASGYAIAVGSGGSLVLDNGASAAGISAAGGHSISTPVIFNSNTTVTFGGAVDSLTISGNISGSGKLTVSGGGTAVLSGANSYAGTNVGPNATLQIGIGGTSGTFGVGPVVNDGLIVLNRSDSPTFSNSISGNGALTTMGGTVSLAGAAQYGGTTTILAGRLVFAGGGPHSVAGITGGGVLEVAANLTSDGVTTDGGWEIDAGVMHTIRTNGSTAGVSEVSALALAGSPNNWLGSLDVSNNGVVILNADAGSKATMLAILQNQVDYYPGHSTGITSSSINANNSNVTRLVVVDNADVQLTSFRGISAGLNSNSLIVGAAHVGDTNLDGQVNSADFVSMAANWNKLAGATWGQGDFVGMGGTGSPPDGAVTSADFVAMAANWNQNVSVAVVPSGLPPAGGSSAVPEPGTLGLLALGGVIIGRGRRPRWRCVGPRIPG